MMLTELLNEITNLWLQIENSNSGSGLPPGALPVVGGPNEDSNTSTGKDDMAKASDWSYYEDIFQVTIFILEVSLLFQFCS